MKQSVVGGKDCMKGKCKLWFKHRVKNFKGIGRRCELCGKTLQKINQDNEQYKMVER